MNRKKVVTSEAFTIVVFCLANVVVYAQSTTVNSLFSPGSVPADERFTVSDELVASWRTIGCSRIQSDRPEHGCNKESHAQEYQSSFTFRIYNQDGTLWWRASLIGNEEYRRGKDIDYFWEHRRKEFEPFAVDHKIYAMGMVLRLVAESPNWWEVEINERTRETKFLYKKDPAWERTTWEFWLGFNGWLSLPENHEPFLDAPGGKVIGESKDRKFTRVRLLATNNDWAFVEGVEPQFSNAKRSQGWIRWRSGRDLLVGCFLNNDEPPMRIDVN